MGLRGPAPKPTPLRILHGDNANRINYDEPITSEGIPEAPDDLTPAARKVWDYIVHELAVMGCARKPDRDQLRAYCEAVRLHADACKFTTVGAVVKDPATGQVKVNPAVRIQLAAARTMLIFAREFGLTPSSRSQIKAEKVANDNTAERLLS